MNIPLQLIWYSRFARLNAISINPLLALSVDPGLGAVPDGGLSGDTGHCVHDLRHSLPQLQTDAGKCGAAVQCKYLALDEGRHIWQGLICTVLGVCGGGGGGVGGGAENFA